MAKLTKPGQAPAPATARVLSLFCTEFEDTGKCTFEERTGKKCKFVHLTATAVQEFTKTYGEDLSGIPIQITQEGKGKGAKKGGKGKGKGKGK